MVFFYFFTFLSLFLLSPNPTLSLNQEGLYLQRVKLTLSDPDSVLESWNNDRNNTPCSWFGVKCNNEDSSAQSVTSIDLSNANIGGPFPSFLCRLQNLTSLSFYNNSINSTLPDDLAACHNLEYLNLAQNLLTGTLPETLADLPNLKYLDLTGNNFSGEIPESFGRFQKLEVISLVYNLFDGTIPPFLGNISSLKMLNLSYNPFLPGRIPPELGNLTNLEILWLTECNLVGEIPDSLGRLGKLVDLDLALNSLVGNIPTSLTELTSVVQIELYHNSLTGELPTGWSNLTMLRFIDASMNDLSGPIPEELTRLPLESLILNDNRFEGNLPASVADSPSLLELRLSRNRLTGQFPIPNNLKILDLHSNLLQGKLPVLPLGLIILSISNNQLTGEIPQCICNMNQLQVLDLSNNKMSGTIPECMGWLDLQNDTFAQCNYLEALNFNNNDLEGPVPRYLVNCKALQVLDLGNNKINDTFPHWLATLPELQVLVLRSNKFYGSVRDSKAKNSFSKLRILDLSTNNFSGSLPIKYFRKLKAMMNVSAAAGKLQYMDFKAIEIGIGYVVNPLYNYSIVVTMKGVDIHMEKILTIFTTMDFSCNKFRGQIPDVVGKLKFLKVLNFSHNDLIGHIPLSFENLTELESLDLSSNRLGGEIPKQLTSLTSLSALNLSYNQLVGHIPQGNQFGTFQNDSYIGNLGLCDFPLSEKCNNSEEPEFEPNESTIFHDEQDVSWFDWKMSLMGYGCGLVIGISMEYIVFSTGKPKWIVSMVDRKYSRKVGRLTGRRGKRN